MDRKTLSILTILTIILVFVSSVTSFATAAPKELTVAVYPNEPLISSQDEKAEGFIVDLLDEIARKRIGTLAISYTILPREQT